MIGGGKNPPWSPQTKFQKKPPGPPLLRQNRLKKNYKNKAVNLKGIFFLGTIVPPRGEDIFGLNSGKKKKILGFCLTKNFEGVFLSKKGGFLKKKKSVFSSFFLGVFSFMKTTLKTEKKPIFFKNRFLWRAQFKGDLEGWLLFLWFTKRGNPFTLKKKKPQKKTSLFRQPEKPREKYFFLLKLKDYCFFLKKKKTYIWNFFLIF